MTRGGGFALVIALAGLTAAEARAEPIPAVLRGKSIELSYTVYVATKSLGGDNKGQTWAGQPTYSYKLYLSLKGRIFTSYQGDAPTARNQVSGTGQSNMEWRYEGARRRRLSDFGSRRAQGRRQFQRSVQELLDRRHLRERSRNGRHGHPGLAWRMGARNPRRESALDHMFGAAGQYIRQPSMSASGDPRAPPVIRNTGRR